VRSCADTDGGYRIINPLSGIPKDELLAQVSQFCADAGLEGKEPIFYKGALVAQSPEEFENMSELDDDDKYHLRREKTSEFGSQFLHYCPHQDLC